ncbi:ABC-type transport auxiliary lipoprotein family protein [Cupriavidus sp. WKF15]|uniref:ABC-type transport auxiliary lipoprotein family protein n=1 Tax=Cupriavidus sp. WKF15 TaxID=3032282 RepID=UPI0023E17E87|nr:ABC-type transport auxiliary lipoprotein family protein [Cupriavidus sp. WKF15]WER49167.1 ABC-type transport auxiliary lipoprotein family protein [Cupriavidus sp. WKF15]
MTRAAAIAALCIASLSGCTLFTPVDIDTKKYAVSTIPDDLPAERTHPATLLVLAPEAAPAYATSRMAYTTRKYQIAYFSQNEWVDTPAQMMQPLIMETLRRTHYFSAVLSPPHSGRHTFVLHTEIVELDQDFTSDPAVLRLTARFDLRQEATNRLITAKELSVQVPLAERTPYAGVVAANEAMGRLLRELSRLVIENAH